MGPLSYPVNLQKKPKCVNSDFLGVKKRQNMAQCLLSLGWETQDTLAHRIGAEQCSEFFKMHLFSVWRVSVYGNSVCEADYPLLGLAPLT